MVQPLWKRIRQLLKNTVTVSSSIPLLEIFPKELEARTILCTPMFLPVLFTIAQTWKQSTCSSLMIEWQNVV